MRRPKSHSEVRQALLAAAQPSQLPLNSNQKQPPSPLPHPVPLDRLRTHSSSLRIFAPAHSVEPKETFLPPRRQRSRNELTRGGWERVPEAVERKLLGKREERLSIRQEVEQQTRPVYANTITSGLAISSTQGELTVSRSFSRQLGYSKVIDQSVSPQRTESKQQGFVQLGERLEASLTRSLQLELSQLGQQQREDRDRQMQRDQTYLQRLAALETQVKQQLISETAAIKQTISQLQMQSQAPANPTYLQPPPSLPPSQQIAANPQQYLEPPQQKHENILSTNYNAQPYTNPQKGSGYLQLSQPAPKQEVQSQKKQEPMKQERDELVVEEVQFRERSEAGRGKIEREGSVKSEQPNKDERERPRQGAAVAISKGPVRTQQAKSIYDEGDSFLNDIQEIRLSPQSKRPQKLSPKRELGEKEKRGQKMIDMSFESEPPTNTRTLPNQREKFTREPSRKDSFTKEVKQEKKESKQKIEKKEANEKEKERERLRAELVEISRADPQLTAIGEVVGYCSKAMKKSKLEWRVPSLLLYRYCYDAYRSHTPLYLAGQQAGLIGGEEVEKFQNDNTVLKDNMLKILRAAAKKTSVQESYRTIVEAEESQLSYLQGPIRREVSKFALLFRRSDEVQDLPSLHCALRMVNAVFLIAALQRKIPLRNTPSIQELDLDRGLQLLTDWETQLKQIPL